MENKTTKQFTIWDSIVLLVLLLILTPFLLSILESIIKQDYYIFFVNLLLSIAVLWGIKKYIKKLFLNYKDPKTKSRTISLSVIILIIVGYFLLCLSRFFN